MSNDLEVSLERVRAGTMGFGAFVAATRAVYRSLARRLARCWATPEWFTLEDIEQELYLETWRVVGKFDPARGKSLARFVVFHAMTQATRAMHRARGVPIHGNPGKVPPRYEMPFSRIGREGEGEEAWLDRMLAEAPIAEEEIARAEECRLAAAAALEACTTKRERHAILAIREAGSLDNAAGLLYDDLPRRIALRLGSEEKAERFVLRHAAAVVQRMGADVNPG